MKKPFDSSVWILIGANLIPLVGVLFWEWSTFEVVALYWLENVIIGAINILKMLTCSPDMKKANLNSMFDERLENVSNIGEEDQQKITQAREMIGKYGNQAGKLNQASKLFLIPFFTLHYGFFCFGHGMFVFLLLGGTDKPGALMSHGPGPSSLSHLVSEAVAQGGAWAALGLTISHLYSFGANYIGKGEYRRTATPMLMIAPYGRIVVLHIAIIFGAFAIMALGSPVYLLVLLIVGKIALDLKLHLRSHRKLRAK